MVPSGPGNAAWLASNVTLRAVFIVTAGPIVSGGPAVNVSIAASYIGFRFQSS